MTRDVTTKPRVPPFVWTLLVGAVLFSVGFGLFYWATNAPAETAESLPWIVKVIAYVAGTPAGWLLLAGPLAFIAVLQLLSWLSDGDDP